MSVKDFTGSQAKEMAAMMASLGEANAIEWDSLLTCKRIHLMEVCCSPESILSSTMQKKKGMDSIYRISEWNGFDMSTKDGLEKARELRRKLRPQHLWTSVPCGPWSTIQNLNQKTEKQRLKLQEKRVKSLRIIRNALTLIKDQVLDGGDAHWEWPKECLGYKLPVVNEFFDEFGMYEAITNGCMVGLKGPKGKPIAKPWKIMTTSKVMAKRMNLRCQGNHEHEPCMGSQTAAASAYYPKAMADKAVNAMLEATTWNDSMQKIKDAASSKACMTAAKEEADDRPLMRMRRRRCCGGFSYFMREAHTHR